MTSQEITKVYQTWQKEDERKAKKLQRKMEKLKGKEAKK